MDLFMEHMVQHKRSAKDWAIVAGIVAGTIIIAAIVFVLCFVLFPQAAGASLAAIVAVMYLSYTLIGKTSVEYEYILTNNELDIDKITARSSRKRVASFSFTSVDICAPITHGAFNNTASITKTIDCTGDGEQGIYFADYTNEGEKIRVIFQPPVSYIENVKRFNPQNIYILPEQNGLL